MPDRSLSALDNAAEQAQDDYQLILALRESADDVADAANAAEATYKKYGGEVSPRLEQQINNDYNVVMQWYVTTAPPSEPKLDSVNPDYMKYEFDWLRLAAKLRKDVRDFTKHGVGRAIKRLLDVTKKFREAAEPMEAPPDTGTGRGPIKYSAPP